MTFPFFPMDYLYAVGDGHSLDFVFCFDSLPNEKHLRESLEKARKDFPWLNCSICNVVDRCEFYQPDFPFELYSETQISEQVTIRDVRLKQSISLRRDSSLAFFRVFRCQNATYLCSSMSHVLGDARSLFMFLSSWAAYCRGNVPTKPNRDHALPIRSVPSSRFEPEEFQEVVGYQLAPDDGWIAKRQHAVDIDYVLSEKEIQKFYSQFEKSGLTRNTILSAALWKALSPVLYPDTRQTQFAQAYDFRGRAGGVDTSYFGNPVWSVFSLQERVAEKSIVELANILMEDIKGVSVRKYCKALEMMTSYRRSRGLSALRCIDISPGDSGLFLSNMTRIPFQFIDFGKSRPHDVWIDMKNPGGVIALPGKGLNLNVSFPEEISPQLVRNALDLIFQIR